MVDMQLGSLQKSTVRPSCDPMVDLQLGPYKHTPPSCESMVDMQLGPLQESMKRPNCVLMVDLQLGPYKHTPP